MVKLGSDVKRKIVKKRDRMVKIGKGVKLKRQDGKIRKGCKIKKIGWQKQERV